MVYHPLIGLPRSDYPVHISVTNIEKYIRSADLFSGTQHMLNRFVYIYVTVNPCNQ